ncbi:MAG TPA: GcrA family cell cycle regulator [Xanthobacteraceae bacterium]
MNAAKPLLRCERDPSAAPATTLPRKSDRAPAKAASTVSRGATWTAERVEELKRCIGAGFTCSQIAREIGVTRNAVIGKMNRLGLSRPKDIRTQPREPKRAPWRPKIMTPDRILLRLAPEPALRLEDISILDGRGCSLLELSAGKCRWPINEPGTDDFCFCGNTPAEGLPYCLGHARIAYRSPARMRLARPGAFSGKSLPPARSGVESGFPSENATTQKCVANAPPLAPPDQATGSADSGAAGTGLRA